MNKKKDGGKENFKIRLNEGIGKKSIVGNERYN